MVAAGGCALPPPVALALVLALVPAGRARSARDAERLHYLDESLRSLRSLGPRLPADCLGEAVNVRISTRPERIKKWSALKLGFQLSSELLQEDVSLAEWLPSPLTKVRELLHRQTRLFSDFHKKRLKKKRIEKYFQELRDFLSRKEHGRCAWEVVRAELEQLFVSFKKFIVISSSSKGGGQKVEKTKAKGV